MIYLQLFFSFLQIGTFSFGGGYAALPLIQNQVVSLHHWISMAEFTDLITISQMTPDHRHQFRHLCRNQDRRNARCTCCDSRMYPALLHHCDHYCISVYEIPKSGHPAGNSWDASSRRRCTDCLCRNFDPDHCFLWRFGDKAFLMQPKGRGNLCRLSDSSEKTSQSCSGHGTCRDCKCGTLPFYMNLSKKGKLFRIKRIFPPS